MKKIFSFIVGLACCGSAAAQQPYTLDQLKQLAVANNFNLRSARNAIQQSKEQQSEAYTKYFPAISATGVGITMNKYLLEADLSLPDELASQLPPSVSAAWPTNIAFMKNGVFGSVSAIQPVFMGGQIINGNKLAKAGVEASEIQLEASEDQVELVTEQYYWQVVSLKEKLLTLSSVHQMLVELEKDVSNAVRVGAVNRNDLLQVQLRKGEVESSTLEVEHALSTLTQLLAQHVGIANETIDVALPADLIDMGKSGEPAIPANLRQDHQSALNATPQYRLLEKNVEVHRLQHRLKVGSNMPKVGVGADYGWNNFVNDRGSGTGTLFAFVQIPISDWWGGSHAIKKQKLALDDAREELTDKSQKLVIHMNSSWAALETSHKKLLIAHSAIEQAEENLRLNKDYYRVGSTKMSDLLLAQQQYQAARDRYTDAYADFQTKQLEYRQATGQD